MIKPGAIAKQVIGSFFHKPVTFLYPAVKHKAPDRLRGKLKFDPSKCIGCKLCMRDCPSNAVHINKVGEKRFEAVIDLDKCIYCGQCAESCMKKALELTTEFELAQLDRNKLRIVYNAPPEENTEEKT